MANENGLRLNSRVEKDIIPFLVRNYLWDENSNEPNKSSIHLGFFEKKEDIIERDYNGKNGTMRRYYYWHFTELGKNAICKLITNIY